VVNNDVIAAARGFVPWGTAGGVPEFVVPGPGADGRSGTGAPRRVDVTVRALPDGVPQLVAPADYGTRIVRFSAPRATLDIRSYAWILDAVMMPDVTAFILEENDDALAVKRVDSTGNTLWTLSDLPSTEHARLLADIRGQVFLATDEFVVRVDDESGRQVAGSRPGGEAVMYRDGHVGFVLFDPRRETRDWIIHDLETGVEKVVRGGDDTDEILARPIGVDAAGCVYGDSIDALGRMTPFGRLDWLFEVSGIAVSPRHGVSVMTLDKDANPILRDESGRTPVDEAAESHSTWLAGRADDGGYVLHAPDNGPGDLRFLDSNGRLVARRQADEDVWLTIDFQEPPSASSVTPDGELLVPVLSRDGVHIVGLRPGEETT
jgi:hypothetical protein